MKNIHLLPTEKPSRLYLFEERLILGDLITVVFKNSGAVNQNIYITSDEHPKPNDFYFDFQNQKVKKCETGYYNKGSKKIILTDNKDLIKDGVQAIDDEFLEWFVKNSSCEEVEVVKFCKNGDDCPSLDIYAKQGLCNIGYKIIIIPKEEPKQETLEEAAEVYSKRSNASVFQENHKKDFINGAKWQQERMYSEEDMKIAWNEAQKLKTECMANGKDKKCYCTNEIHCQHKRLVKFSEWFEKFKKK